MYFFCRGNKQVTKSNMIRDAVRNFCSDRGSGRGNSVFSGNVWSVWLGVSRLLGFFWLPLASRCVTMNRSDAGPAQSPCVFKG